MIRTIYFVIGYLSLGFYSIAAVQGWELPSSNTERGVVPADVRNSPGGYRSFHFWHSGFRGGK